MRSWFLLQNSEILPVPGINGCPIKMMIEFPGINIWGGGGIGGGVYKNKVCVCGGGGG